MQQSQDTRQWIVTCPHDGVLAEPFDSHYAAMEWLDYVHYSPYGQWCTAGGHEIGPLR